MKYSIRIVRMEAHDSYCMYFVPICFGNKNVNIDEESFHSACDNNKDCTECFGAQEVDIYFF